jgi:peptidyl-prolyl cis-trans isomerase B (cyclophilin B)
MIVKNNRLLVSLVLVFALVGLAVGGCASKNDSAVSVNQAKTDVTTTTQSTTIEETPAATPETTPQKQDTKTPAVSSNTTMSNYKPRLEGKATVEMVINGSPVTIEIDGDNAPVTAGNFVDLVERGVYNNLVFHRVVKEPQPFVAQGGDPDGTGMGGFIDPRTKKRRSIPLEIKMKGEEEAIYSKAFGMQTGGSAPDITLKHTRGAIAMARSQSPDSASSQFYFALADLEFLDGSYAVFGYVTKGMEVIDKIEQGDKINSAKVTKGAENLQK